MQSFEGEGQKIIAEVVKKTREGSGTGMYESYVRHACQEVIRREAKLVQQMLERRAIESLKMATMIPLYQKAENLGIQRTMFASYDQDND